MSRPRSRHRECPWGLHCQDALNGLWDSSALVHLAETAATRNALFRLRDQGELHSPPTAPRLSDHGGGPWVRPTLAVHPQWAALGLSSPGWTGSNTTTAMRGPWIEPVLAALMEDALSLAEDGWRMPLSCTSSDRVTHQIILFRRVMHALNYRGHTALAAASAASPSEGRRRTRQRSMGSQSRDETTASLNGSVGRGASPIPPGQDALVELGVTSGLAMVFGLLQQNWRHHEVCSSSPDLCNGVLETFLGVLQGLSPLALAQSARMSPIGQRSLEQVAQFLIPCIDPERTRDRTGSRLSAEALLALAIQRGSLTRLLQWSLTCLRVLEAKRPDPSEELKIAARSIQHAIAQIRTVTDPIPVEDEAHVHRFNRVERDETDLVNLYDGVMYLFQELVAQSTAYTAHCTTDGKKSAASKSSNTAIPKLRSRSLGCEVFVWGSNSSNQLGEGLKDKLVDPKLSEVFQDVVKIEAGQVCTFVLHGDGQVSACGKGSYGRLGFGDSNNQMTPRILHIGGPVKDISSSKASDGHTLALTERGEVFSWGDGDYGKLGHGNTTTQKIPKRIQGALENKVVTQISAGYRHSAAVTEEGHLFTWGEGDFGRLGHGDSQSRNVPTQVKDIGLVRQVACGASNTLALSEDSMTVWSFGSGDHGKLGHGEVARVYRPKTIDALQGIQIEKIVAGSQVSMALSTKGKIWVWGTGPLLGTGCADSAMFIPKILDELADQHVVDISIGDSTCLALTQDCTVYSWGTNTIGQCGLGHSNSPICSPQKIRGLSGVPIHQISAGNAHSLAWTTLPIHRQVVLWHKPFCAEFDSVNFKTMKELLSAFKIGWCGSEKEEDMASTSPFKSLDDYNLFLSGVIRILSSHFMLVNASNGDETKLIGSDKKELEATLYGFIDKDDCPDQVRALVEDCLVKGTKFLMAPISERISKASELLHMEKLTKGQNLHLKIILQSLNDPMVMGTLLTLRLIGDNGEISSRMDYTFQKHIFGFIRILSLRQFKYFLSDILKVELGSDVGPQDYIPPHQKAEESSILLALIAQIIRHNINPATQEFEAEFLQRCVSQLNLILDVSVELLDCCRNILKTEDVNGLERVRECLCQSFFPSLLQTVIVSLFDLQSTFKDELLDSVQKVQKSAWDLERLICNLVDELDFGEWNVFLEMQITCTAALSKSYGEALCQSVQAHLLGPLESLSQLSLIRNGAITHSRLYLHVGHTLDKIAAALAQLVTSEELDFEQKVFRINRKCLSCGIAQSDDEWLIAENLEKLRQSLLTFEGIPVDRENEQSFLILGFFAQGLQALLGIEDARELTDISLASTILGEMYEKISQWKYIPDQQRSEDLESTANSNPKALLSFSEKLERAIGVSLFLDIYFPKHNQRVDRVLLIKEAVQLFELHVSTKERTPLETDVVEYLRCIRQCRQKIDDGYPKAIKLLNLCVGYDTEAKHLPEMIHRREMVCQVLGGLLCLDMVPAIDEPDGKTLPPLTLCLKRPFVAPEAENSKAILNVLGKMVKSEVSKSDRADETSLVMILSLVLVEISKSEIPLGQEFSDEILSVLSNDIDLRMMPRAHSIAQKLGYHFILASRFNENKIDGEKMVEIISRFLGRQLAYIESSGTNDEALDFLLFLELSASSLKTWPYFSRIVSLRWLSSLMNILNQDSATLRLQLVCLSAVQTVLHAQDGNSCSKDERLSTIRTLFQQVHQIMWHSTHTPSIPCIHVGSKLRFEFNVDQSCFVNLEKNGLAVHSPGGRGFCRGQQGFSSGCVQWTYNIVKETKGNEATCIGIAVKDVKDFNHRTTKDMWLYRAYSGHLYHGGEMRESLPDFTQGDSITAYLDMEDRTLSFGKNNQPPQLAFSNLPAGVELYPCVVFYSLNPGERVRISEVTQSVKSFDVVSGKPFCAPDSETLAQALISVLQATYMKKRLWQSVIQEYLEMSLLSSQVTEGFDEIRDLFLNLGMGSTDLLIKLEALMGKVYSSLAFLSTIDTGLRVGSLVEYGPNAQQGIILGCPVNSAPNVKVFWTHDQSHSIISPQKLLKEGKLLNSCSHEFQAEIPPSLMAVIQRLSCLDACATDFGALDLWSLIRKMDAKSSSKIASRLPEYASRAGSNLQRPSRRCHRPNACSHSSAELFSDQLVSSILSEVRETASRSPCRSPSIVRVDNLFTEDFDLDDMTSEDSSARTSLEQVLTIPDLEEALLKMLSLQRLASKTVINFMKSPHPNEVEDTQEQTSRDRFQSISPTVFRDSLKNLDLSNQCTTSNFSLLYHDEEFNRAIAICKSNASSPSKASHHRSTKPILINTRNTSQASILAGEDVSHVPIFRPLFEMGFTNSQISRAMTNLEINGYDTSARTINRCASWMIDNPPSDLSPHAMERMISRTQGGSAAMAVRLWPDIRDFFNLGRGNERRGEGGNTARTIGRASGAIRRRLRRRDSNPDLDVPVNEVAFGSAGTTPTDSSNANSNTSLPFSTVSIPPSTEPWASPFRSCFNPNRTRRRDMAVCGICFEEIQPDQGPITQHQREAHPGCNKPLDNAVCGGLLEDKYVLCQDCIVQYAEITRSMPASDILATSRHASGDTSGSSSSSSSASFISLTRNPKSETSPLFASNPMTPDLVINDELNIREKPNVTPNRVIEEEGVSELNPSELTLELQIILAQFLRYGSLEDNMSGKPLLPNDLRVPSNGMGQNLLDSDESLYYQWKDYQAVRLKSKPWDQGAHNRITPPLATPLWFQAHCIVSRSDNIIALAQLQRMIALQTRFDLIFLCLECAASWAFRGNFLRGKEILSNHGLNDVRLLLGLLKRLARVESETSLRSEQANAGNHGETNPTPGDDLLQAHFLNVRPKVEAALLALRCLLRTNPSDVRLASILALHNLTRWVKLDYYVDNSDAWLLRKNAFIDQRIIEEILECVRNDFTHSFSNGDKKKDSDQQQSAPCTDEVEMSQAYLEMDALICETMATLLLNWKSPTKLRFWASKVLLRSISNRVNSNPPFKNVDHADYQKVLPALHYQIEELNVINPMAINWITTKCDNSQAMCLEANGNIYFIGSSGSERVASLLPDAEDLARHPVRVCEWSPCHKRVAFGYDNVLCIWHIPTAEDNYTAPRGRDMDTLVQMSSVTAMNWSEIGSSADAKSNLLLGRTDGTVAIMFDDGIREMPAVTRAHVSVRSVVWLNDSDEEQNFLVAFEDGKIVLGSPSSPDSFKQIQTDEDNIHQFELCANHLILGVSALDRKFVSIWGRTLGEFACTSTKLPHPSIVEVIAWSPLIKDKVLLAVGQRDGGIALWQIDSSGFGKPEHAQLLWGHPYQALKILKFHPDGNLLASVSDQGSKSLLNVWSLSTGSVIHTDQIDHDIIQSCVWVLGENESRLLVSFASQKAVIKSISFPSQFALFNLKIASGCRAALLGKGADVLYRTPNLRQFFHHLGTFLREQYEEEIEDIDRTVKFSRFLQDLLRLIVELNLDDVFIHNPIIKAMTDEANDVLSDGVDWGWVLDYIYSLRALKALALRNKTNITNFQSIANTFLQNSGERIDPNFEVPHEVLNAPSVDLETSHNNTMTLSSLSPTSEGVSSVTQSEVTSISSHSDSSSLILDPSITWTIASDCQLMQWATEFPTDWQVGGKCQAYGFGTGRSGQLAEVGSIAASPTEIPSFSEARQVVCALNCTFIIHSNGSLSACGQNENGRLGLGNSEDQQVLALISALKGFSICQLASSKGGEGHTLALATSGEVFSWGDGDWGKLGHGNSDRVRRPRPITALRHRYPGSDVADLPSHVRFVATGFRHSALISKAGHLYTFGKGDTGALGHGHMVTLKQPQFVSDLRRHKVGFVACGASHTVCVSQDGLQTWSFGSNDNGQLGHGILVPDTCPSPKIIDSLKGLQVKKVALGDGFSVFLTSKGQVFTCGQAQLAGLPESLASLFKPTQIPALENVLIIDIAVGGYHTLALSNKGEVWVWGKNNFEQAGLNTAEPWILTPKVIPELSDKFILQISAGSFHSVAWSTPPLPPSFDDTPRLPSLGLPSTIPTKFSHLVNFSIHALRDRLKILYLSSNLVSQAWKFYPSSQFDLLHHDEVRKTLSHKVYHLPLVQILQKTMNSSRNQWPQVVVKRLNLPEEDDEFPATIFVQISKQVQKLELADLRSPDRAWKVKLLGEGADDAGGVFDDIMTEMCRELMDPQSGLNLLLPTPNGVTNIGIHRDKFLLNSAKNTDQDLRHFWFLGILCGIAIRTKKPIALNLAPFVWKLIVGSEISWNDLEDVDLNYARSLRALDGPHLLESHLPNDHFEGISFAGQMVSLLPSPRVPLNLADCSDYVKAAFRQRQTEMADQVRALREGLGAMVPFPIVGLMPAKALEELVCGQPSISLPALKKAARYRDFDHTHPVIIWLWDILESFSDEERILFVIFVSGRSRLPNNPEDLPQRFQILRVDKPENGLPTAQTCFFQLRLPPFTDRQTMEEKLRYAIYHCRSIDMDQYMLRRDSNPNGT